MAEIVESQEEVVEGAVDITQETQQEEVVEQPQEEVVQEQAPVEENVPTKYKGKSLDEIIRMHQEAEKLIGRQAQEVGEVRNRCELTCKSVNTSLNLSKWHTVCTICTLDTAYLLLLLGNIFNTSCDTCDDIFVLWASTIQSPNKFLSYLVNTKNFVSCCEESNARLACSI